MIENALRNSVRNAIEIEIMKGKKKLYLQLKEEGKDE
jgi:hypothetical protein